MSKSSARNGTATLRMSRRTAHGRSSFRGEFDSDNCHAPLGDGRGKPPRHDIYPSAIPTAQNKKPPSAPKPSTPHIPANDFTVTGNAASYSFQRNLDQERHGLSNQSDPFIGRSYTAFSDKGRWVSVYWEDERVGICEAIEARWRGYGR